jgi:CheY-like chemotaxis protein
LSHGKSFVDDDEVTMVQMVTELLRREGHEVFPFSSYNAAIETLEAQCPELVITDLYLDKTAHHGLEILQKARALNPPPPSSSSPPTPPSRRRWTR